MIRALRADRDERRSAPHREEESMQDLVYPRERALGAITLVIGLVLWLALVIGTWGGVLRIFTPSVDAGNRVVWKCSGGEGTRTSQLPPACR
jgi:hypothetical protein